MRPLLIACAFASIALAILSCGDRSTAHGAEAGDLPRPAYDVASLKEGEARTLVVAAGCFWCVEAVFEPLNGVKDVVSGYAGGTADTADYKKVSSGQTDHAESVQITYDPSKITLGTLLRVFFTMHNPSTKDGQHPDYGRQYRSAIFYADDEQKKVAEAYIKQLRDTKSVPDGIVTTLEPLEKFYPAEEYHQDYVKRNPEDPYVVRWALPKLEKLKKKFPELLKDAPPPAKKSIAP